MQDTETHCCHNHFRSDGIANQTQIKEKKYVQLVHLGHNICYILLYRSNRAVVNLSTFMEDMENNALTVETIPASSFSIVYILNSWKTVSFSTDDAAHQEPEELF